MLDHLDRCLAAIQGAILKECGIWVKAGRGSMSTFKRYSDGLIQEGGNSIQTGISIKIVYKSIALWIFVGR